MFSGGLRQTNDTIASFEGLVGWMLMVSLKNLGTLTLQMENLTNVLNWMWQLLDTMSMHAIPYNDTLLQVCNNYVTCYIAIYIYVCALCICFRN